MGGRVGYKSVSFSRRANTEVDNEIAGNGTLGCKTVCYKTVGYKPTATYKTVGREECKLQERRPRSKLGERKVRNC